MNLTTQWERLREMIKKMSPPLSASTGISPSFKAIHFSEGTSLPDATTLKQEKDKDGGELGDIQVFQDVLKS